MSNLKPTDLLIETAQLPLVNNVALHETVQAACPHFDGISTGSKGLVMHFTAGVTDTEREQARQIALAHDPKVLSTDQQAAVDREAARQAVLAEVAKKADPTPLERALIHFFELTK